ncbi:MAG: substrate-binding domain-containing protein [Anaerolineae bacterium]|nr:substrate-binding domain-containing protein [Anaerolineae bacterium]
MRANSRNPKRPRIGVLAGWQVYGGTLDTYLNQTFGGILSAATDHECDLMLACGLGSPRDIGEGRPAWPVLLPEADFVPVGPWNADGLLVVLPITFEKGAHYFDQLVADGYPVVFAGTGERGPSVIADNEGGIRQAFAHLVGHGHRRIAFIAGHEHRAQGDSGRRLAAFRSALQAWGLPHEPGLIAHGYHTVAGGRQAMEQILRTGIPFTAVLASNDESAIGAMNVLQEHGLLVPQDVAVIGFDDRLGARAQLPPLTTVHYPMFEVGYRALGLLIETLTGHTTTDAASSHSRMFHPETVRVPTWLVVRESCGCLPGLAGGRRSQEGIATPTPPLGSVEINRPGVLADRLHIVEAMVAALSATVHRPGADEIRYLCRRLVEALVASLEQNSPDIFYGVLQQVLHRMTSLGNDPNVWQVAISLLRDQRQFIGDRMPHPVACQQVQDTLDQARIAISEHAQEQYARHLIHQAETAYQFGQMIAQFHAAETEAEVYGALARSLPQLRIQHAVVASYEPEGKDPVALTIAHSPNAPDGGSRRFPTRAFPPPGLYPDDEPLSIALLPLVIQDKLRGFVAFDTGNLEISGDLARQLAAALRSVGLYREAVEGQRLAEEANRLKSRFLSMVSHELRTPLNLISGLTDLLLREGIEISPGKYEVNWEDIERIYVNAKHLDDLIRDVLDLAQSETGQLKLVREPLDLGEVLAELAVIGGQLVRDKGLAWRIEIPSEPLPVWGDRTRLRQVVLNLVNNAVKFTARGEIALTASVEDGRVTVSVQDTGLGIPAAEQEAIFDEFWQSGRTAARGYGGLGLGLAICKRLVEGHGGEIGVRSSSPDASSGEERMGSTFYFTLPTMERREVCPPAETLSAQQGYVALLVKDAGTSRSLQEHLTRRGFDVEVYAAPGAPSSGSRRANWLSRLLSDPPRAAILDLGLASERGWQVIRLLKENASTRDVPVLFAALADGQRAGATVEIDYLAGGRLASTPKGSTELCEALLRRRLTRHGPTRRGPTSGKGDEQDTGKILVVDDDPGVLEMHTRIVKAQLPGSQVLCARNGREALQVIQQERPDLVVLDLMMPELDGFGVLEAMHDSIASRNIPVIVLTGQVLTQEDMSRLSQGVTYVLEKGLLSVEETLAHIEAVLNHSRQPSYDAQQIVRRAMAFIHAHYAESISRADVAFDVGVSERHLARCFSKETGLTVSAYLNRYRIREAKRLLEAGDKSVTEVALEVGFSSSSYFGHVFRQETGMSPGAYRRGER